MAASQRQIDLINRKLEDLQLDSQALQDALSSYVEHVMSVGRKWVVCHGTSGPAFNHIFTELTKSWTFIVHTEQQVTAGQSMESTDFSDTQASTVSPSVRMSSTLSSSSSSDLLAMSRPPSLADHLLIKLQDRLETVEKEMTHVVEIKEEMDGMKEGMDKVKEEIDGFRAGINGLNDNMKKVKKTNKDMKGKMENLQMTMEEYEESKTEMEETISEIKTDHDELSVQVRKLSDNYEEKKVKNHSWLRKFEDRMFKHEQSSISVTGDLEAKMDGLGQRVVSAENRIGEVEKEKEDESTKVKKLEERVIELEKDHDKLELIEERVGELEADMRDVQGTKLEGIEERISHLEEEKADQETQNMLEKMLKDIEEDRGEEKKAVGDLKTELTRCVSRVDAIDIRRQLQVAVHAVIPRGLSHTLKKDTVLTCFTDFITNKGGHYDPSTGVFTAPVDGAYMTSLVHRQLSKDYVELILYHGVHAANPGPGGVREEKVCVTFTNVQYTSCTSVNVVWMSAGDKLYVKMTDAGFGDNWEIHWPSCFFCYLIS